jgi:hypothetical protein
MLSPEGLTARQERAKTAAATKASEAQAAKDTAEANKAGYELTLMKAAGNTDPAESDAIVDRILPPDKFPTDNANFKVELRNAGKGMSDLNQASRAHSEVIQRMQALAGARSPEAFQAEARKAAAVAAATEGIDIDKAKKIELAKASLAPGAFSAIIDPTARSRAISDADAMDKAYIDKLGTVKTLNDTIDLALSGNKAAPTMAVIDQLRTVVNRVNRQELEQVKGAGSAWDNVRGWVNGKIEGQPIPPNILNDMKTLAGAQATTADSVHEANRIRTNSYLGAKLPDNRADIKQAMGFNAPGGAGGGKTYTQADVDRAVSQTPGLTAAAADAAFKAKGWTKR